MKNSIEVLDFDKSDENRTRWVSITGSDYGTGYVFFENIYGITTDNKILDCDGNPMVEGDTETIAVRNSTFSNLF